MVNRLLCMIGFHDWEYKKDKSIIFVFETTYPYKLCKNCGETKEGCLRG